MRTQPEEHKIPILLNAAVRPLSAIGGAYTHSLVTDLARIYKGGINKVFEHDH
jgi:hypothetical protein